MFNHKELKTYSPVLLVSPLALPIPKNFMPLLCFFSNHSCHHIFPRISVTYLHRFLSRGSSRLSAHKAVLPWQVQWISDWRSCQSAWTCLKCKYGDCIFEWKKKKSSLNICVICNICKLGQVSTIFYHLVQFIHHRLWLLWSRMEV